MDGWKRFEHNSDKRPEYGQYVCVVLVPQYGGGYLREYHILNYMRSNE